jgi:hypothetical protein
MRRKEEGEVDAKVTECKEWFEPFVLFVFNGLAPAEV